MSDKPKQKPVVEFDAAQFMRDFGGWAKWSDCEDMVDSAFWAGYKAALEDIKQESK